MKKKLLFTIYNLELGGTEKAFINLLRNLDFDKYDVDVLIQKKEGVFLERLPREVNIIDFKEKETSNIFLRVRNKLRLIYYKNKLKNKYDFSVCFTSWNYNCADVAVNVCENSALWMHADYLKVFDNDINSVKKLFDSQKIEQFRHVVFVSEDALESMKKVYPSISDRMIVCNNYIDKSQILEKANQENLNFKFDETLFVNISRHDEKQKSISRILYASKRLKDEGYKFKVWLVGEGKDTKQYEKIVKDEEIEDIVEFKGVKDNPYPYYKVADCHILCSDSEGYGMSNIESLILGTPVITTDVAGMGKDIDGKYGIVIEKSIDGVYNGMKKFINDNFQMTKEFSIDEANLNVLNVVNQLVENNL